MRVAGRLVSAPNTALREVYVAHVDAVVRRSDAAPTLAFPGLPATELIWRMHFVIGAMIRTWTTSREPRAHLGRPGHVPRGAGRHRSPHRLLRCRPAPPLAAASR
jgi:hypothetical protein